MRCVPQLCTACVPTHDSSDHGYKGQLSRQWALKAGCYSILEYTDTVDEQLYMYNTGCHM